MTTTVTAAELRSACVLLSSTALIRLVTEIDDNGPILTGRLASTLPDVPRHQLRRAIDAAREHGLVTTATGAGLALTTAGEELADLYDVMARWSRCHAYPATVCNFTTRIRHALRATVPAPVLQPVDGRETGSRPTGDADVGLAQVQTQLTQWIDANLPLVGVGCGLAA